MSIRKLNRQVYRREITNKGLPIRHYINFSLSRWRFDELRIHNAEYTCVIKEVIDNEVWIVYEMNEKGCLKEVSLYRKFSEAESVFLSCLENNNIIRMK
jgi:hypothetical protein